MKCFTSRCAADFTDSSGEIPKYLHAGKFPQLIDSDWCPNTA